MNVALLGHVDAGKTTLARAITQVILIFSHTLEGRIGFTHWLRSSFIRSNCLSFRNSFAFVDTSETDRLRVFFLLYLIYARR